MTVVIPTRNEADRLPDCLASVRWAAEVIVADAGSVDDTVAIASALGARVIDVPGLTIGGQRNAALDVASYSWILYLDADERVTPVLCDAIRDALREPAADAYRIHFSNQYLGARMTRGGWGRDWHVRLARASARWTEQQVHERLACHGTIASLRGTIEHDSYRSLAHQLEKVTTYARWGAEDLHRRGTRAGVSHLVVRPLFRFVKCYVLQGAWLEGWRGVVLAAVHAWSAFAKYALLWDLQRQATGVAPHVRQAAVRTMLAGGAARAPRADTVSPGEGVTTAA